MYQDPWRHGRQQLLHTVQDAYGALGRDDLVAFCALLDDQIEWRHPLGFGAPLGGTHLGPVAVAQNVVRTSREQWAQLTYTPHAYLSGAEHVIALGRSIYVSHTGTRGSAEFAHVWLFADDRVVGVRVFEDTAIAGLHRHSTQGHVVCDPRERASEPRDPAGDPRESV